MSVWSLKRAELIITILEEEAGLNASSSTISRSNSSSGSSFKSLSRSSSRGRAKKSEKKGLGSYVHTLILRMDHQPIWGTLISLMPSLTHLQASLFHASFRLPVLHTIRSSPSVLSSTLKSLRVWSLNAVPLMQLVNALSGSIDAMEVTMHAPSGRGSAAGRYGLGAMGFLTTKTDAGKLLRLRELRVNTSWPRDDDNAAGGDGAQGDKEDTSLLSFITPRIPLCTLQILSFIDLPPLKLWTLLIDSGVLLHIRSLGFRWYSEAHLEALSPPSSPLSPSFSLGEKEVGCTNLEEVRLAREMDPQGAFGRWVRKLGNLRHLEVSCPWKGRDWGAFEFFEGLDVRDFEASEPIHTSNSKAHTPRSPHRSGSTWSDSYSRRGHSNPNLKTITYVWRERVDPFAIPKQTDTPPVPLGAIEATPPGTPTTPTIGKSARNGMALSRLEETKLLRELCVSRGLEFRFLHVPFGSATGEVSRLPPSLSSIPLSFDIRPIERLGFREFGFEYSMACGMWRVAEVLCAICS
jgi:hypothetical protein